MVGAICHLILIEFMCISTESKWGFTYYSVNQANLKFSSFSLGLGYIIKGEDILPRPKILDFFVSVFSKHFCFVFLTMASFNL